ncbi:hypothetical protein [Fulvivirga sediminis]|uniref:Uncharacterized protein n=1 Tax=Fulvivirga sediminis TaxID=2803949 RepID=A0A937F702_9BACT|nr:hypothetical protein [Fulvivirga sediminis]MBL3656900.1 hypothetical protein [Fulvivirga sediminis]
MDRKKASLTEVIAKDLKKGYWKASDAARYAPMLFAMVPPSDLERQAVAAIECSQEKEANLKQLRLFVQKEQDGQSMLKDFEQIMRGGKDKLLGGNDDNNRDYKEIIMMLLATNFASHKSSVTLSANVNDLYKQVYEECSGCELLKNCKSASAILTEYIVKALKELGTDILNNPS